MDITDAIEHVLDQFGMEPKEVNEGWCFDFAEQVCRLVPGAQCGRFQRFSDSDSWELFGSYEPSDNFHCIIEFRNRYYDSECAEGADRWASLPIFQRELETNLENPTKLT